MAKILRLNEASEKSKIINDLQKAVQSAHLNFLIGSGCSSPEIPTLGNVEKRIQGLIDEGKSNDAEVEIFNYLGTFLDSYNKLSGSSCSSIQKILDDYQLFLKIIFQCLSKRENNILPKQATIFSTNYDLFVEKAFEGLEMQVRLSDGFSRVPLLTSRFSFSPTEFFNSVLNNGNLYNYQVQIPSINLIKVHGSLSWQLQDNDIVFSTEWLKEAIEDRKNALPDTQIDSKKNLNQKFAVVLPKKEKFKDAILNQTYYDLLRIYANQLDKENVLLIVIGFSFSDEHILEITKRALRNPTLKIIIFCYKVAERDLFKNKFSPFNNVDIVCSDNSDVSFSDASLTLEKVFQTEDIGKEGSQN